MVQNQAGKATTRRRTATRLAGSIGLGLAAGAATAAGRPVGRKAAAAAKVGQGHSLKHRVLDLAAGTIQPKYPLDAMSTYVPQWFPHVRRKHGEDSHHYEVKSGLLVAPGIPELAERAYFSDLVSTYGNPFHTWQYDRDDFPYEIPQLMMGPTGDGQADQRLARDRDRSSARPPTPQGAEPRRYSRPAGGRGRDLL